MKQINPQAFIDKMTPPLAYTGRPMGYSVQRCSTALVFPCSLGRELLVSPDGKMMHSGPRDMKARQIALMLNMRANGRPLPRGVVYAGMKKLPA